MRAAGKKKPVCDRCDAEAPPPKPHSAAMANSTQNGVEMSCTTKPTPIAGNSRISVDSASQVAPPTQDHTIE